MRCLTGNWEKMQKISNGFSLYGPSRAGSKGYFLLLKALSPGSCS